MPFSNPRPHRPQESSRMSHQRSETANARPPSPRSPSRHRPPSPFPRYDVSAFSEKPHSHPSSDSQSPSSKSEVGPSRAFTPIPTPPSRHSARQSYPASPQPSPVRFGFPQPRHSLSYPSPYPISSDFALPSRSLHSEYVHPPRKMRLYSVLRPWIPFLSYVVLNGSFLFATLFWRKEVFTGLDNLSSWLKADRLFGYGVLFSLIFVTTIPPLPLYSTLIILSGYTYGAWVGAVISYWAALTGALVVFVLSRYFFRDAVTRWLASVTSVKRVVRAIEKRPKLLFLIRLAPYPYNVMNCLLGASPTLTLETYTTCTALSLFKVIIHTTLGSSIHSFARYNLAAETGTDGVPDPSDEEGEEENAGWMYVKVIGVALCVGIFVYISYIARKAVNEELDDIDFPVHTDEEAVSFLSESAGRLSEEEAESGGYATHTGADGPMSERPFNEPITAASAVEALSPGEHPRRTGRGGTGGARGLARERRGGPEEEEDIGLD